jgi:hypothetical protein
MRSEYLVNGNGAPAASGVVWQAAQFLSRIALTPHHCVPVLPPDGGVIVDGGSGMAGAPERAAPPEEGVAPLPPLAIGALVEGAPPEPGPDPCEGLA